MLANWFDAHDSADLLRRLDGLTLSARPRWGTFSPADRVCHLTDPVRVALGEKQAKPLGGLLSTPGMAHFVVWLMPWPKGAATTPEFLPGTGMTKSTEFQQDKQTLVDALRRLSDVSPQHVLAPSPVFGQLSRRGWGRLMWRHVDHHLRQFGL